MNNHVRVAVVGSFAVGLTMKLERFPVAGETLLGAGYRTDPGGKGSNQAVGCARLGAKVSFIACIGQDAMGDSALAMYRKENVDTIWLRRSAEQPTGVGFILVKSGSGENCIALDPGANELLTAQAVTASDDAFSSALVVLTQLEIPAGAAGAAMEAGRRHGAITILNPAPARTLPAEVLRNVDILTPNQSEAKALLGLAPDAAVGHIQLARELLKLRVRQVILTLGVEGALVATLDGEQHVAAVVQQAVDTTGAGDSFNAGLAVALAHGASLEAAVRFAVITGGMAVTKEGVIPSLPNRREVLEFCRLRRIEAPEWLAPGVMAVAGTPSSPRQAE